MTEGEKKIGAHRFLENLVRQPNSVEALKWLQQDGVRCTLSGGDGSDSALEGENLSAYIRNLYKIGAKQIIAIQVAGYGEETGYQDTDTLMIELPEQPDKRSRLFDFEADHARTEGFDPDVDQGQKYLLLKRF